MTKEKAEQILIKLLEDFQQIENDRTRLENFLDLVTEDMYQFILEKEKELTYDDGTYTGRNISLIPIYQKSTNLRNTNVFGVSDKRIFNLEEMIENRLEKDFNFTTAEVENFVKDELETLYPMLVDAITCNFHRDYKYRRHFISYEGDLIWLFGEREWV